MTTEKQIVANRKNGLKGGVKTPEGKVISSKNSYKHGLTTKQLTSLEEKEMYKKVLDGFIKQYNPDDIIGYMLCERMAIYYTKMLRVANLESVFINRTELKQKISYFESIQPQKSYFFDAEDGMEFASKESEKEHYEIGNMLSSLKKALNLINSDYLQTDALSELQKLQSYQIMLENAFYKIVDRLEKHIALRAKMFQVFE